ncbi:MAG TPA: hypothetical protein VGS07_03270 [Thermoanaerobaculia bacterium]|jgi:hypothetical protein|nr:hypothetical protein [Thermoanaerobaculia bacterium]
MSAHEKRSRLYWKLGILTGTVLCLAASVWPIRVTFNIVARADWVTVAISPQANDSWYMRNVQIFRGYSAIGETFTGIIQPGPGSSLSIERIGLGPLRLRLQADSSQVAAVLRKDSDLLNVVVNDRLVVTSNALNEEATRGSLIALPLHGKFSVGSPLGLQGARHATLLREGKLLLLGHSLLGTSLFDAGTSELHIGDEVHLDDARKESGLIVADYEPSLKVAVRGLATKASVARFGGSGYTVAASVGERLTNDRPLQAMWAILVGGYALLRSRFRSKKGDAS